MFQGLLRFAPLPPPARSRPACAGDVTDRKSSSRSARRTPPLRRRPVPLYDPWWQELPPILVVSIPFQQGTSLRRHHGARFGRLWLTLIKLLQQNHATAIARTAREMRRGTLTPHHGKYDTGKNASPGMGCLPPRMPTTFLSLTGAGFALTWLESNSAAASLARLTVPGRNNPVSGYKNNIYYMITKYPLPLGDSPPQPV